MRGANPDDHEWSIFSLSNPRINRCWRPDANIEVQLLDAELTVTIKGNL